MEEDVSSKPQFELARHFAFVGKKSTPSAELVAASQSIARGMTARKINYYLSVAQESVSKANAAMLMGVCLLLLGIFAGLASRNATSSTGIWIAQAIFVLIGVFLIYRGFVGKAQAVRQSWVMARALRIKQESD